MKIIIYNYEYPPLGGGAGNASAYIARELVKLGCHVQVITSTFNGLPSKELVDGVHIHRVLAIRRKPHQCSPWEMMTYVVSSSLSRLFMSQDDLPVISFAFHGVPSGIANLILKIFRGVPFITFLRGGDVPGWLPEDLKTYHALTKPLIKYIWRQSKLVIANSRGLRDLALKTDPEQEIEVIPNGVDTDFFTPSSRKTILEHLRLFFAGRLTVQKGMEYLIDALSLLKIQFPNHAILLTVAGYGPIQESLQKRAAELTVQTSIRFLPWLSQEDLKKEYQATDIFVFPSLYEGMSNVVLEAMASGLPIVATAIAGNEELVKDGENGFLVPVRDSKALAHAIAKFIEDPTLVSRMGELSRKIVLENYGWGQIARRIYDSCTRILDIKK